MHVGLPGLTGDNSIGDYNRMPGLEPHFQAPPHWNVNMRGEPGIFSHVTKTYLQNFYNTCKGYNFYVDQ